VVRCYDESVSTRGEGQIIDVTADVRKRVGESGIREGTVSLFVPGATAGLTTLEYEPGCVQDLTDCFDRLAPREAGYAHELAWHDGNGHSHVRAAVLGPSLVLPVRDGVPALGTWQQIVLIDFDNKPRARRWTLTVMGE
jgi:secondary thiamine-phosphate synthase enzyme